MTIRKTMLTAALLGAFAAPAMAQDAAGNLVGGAMVRLVGGGDDAVMVVEQAPHAQPRRLAEPGWGNGGGTAVRYLEPAPAAPGRHMTLVGGGEDAQLVAVPGTAPARGLAEAGGRPRG